MAGRRRRARWGLFEAPVAPPAPRLRLDAARSPLRLSRAIVAAALPWTLPGALLLVLFHFAGMLLPVAIGALVDRVAAPLAGGAAWATVAAAAVWSLAAVAGLYAVMNLGYRFGGRLGWYGVQRCQHELSEAIVGRLLHPRGMAGPERAPGELLSLATADVHRACLVLYAVVYPPGEIVGLAVAIAVLVAANPALGLGVLIALPVLLGSLQLAARPLRRRSGRELAGLADATAEAADLVAGYRVIRGLHAQAVAAARYREVSRGALRATLSARSARAGFEGLSTGAAQAFAAAVVIAAALLAFTGELTGGQLITVAGVAVLLIGPIESLVGTLGAVWAMSQASALRVVELAAAGPHPARTGTAVPGDPVARADVVFDRLALPGGAVLDTTVRAGDLVAVDLPQPQTAALADALALRDVPADGSVRFQGLALHEHDPEHLGARMLVAPHVPGVFSGTVLDEVCGCGPDPVPDAAARAALAAAGLSESELADGYRTPVGDGGRELSGGQRQRLALARALASDPDVLVLIEPTSSVDAVTEQRVAEAVRRHRAGRTTLVLTSSPAFHAVADRAVVPRAEVLRDA